MPHDASPTKPLPDVQSPPRYRRSAVRRWAFRTAAVVGSFAIAYGAGELLLRVLGYSPAFVNPVSSFHEPDPRLGFRGRPDLKARFVRPDFDIRIEHNHAGFRKVANRIPPEQAACRVHVFGDSFTWGWGVGQGEVFTDHLSRLLAESHVANYGINASGTCMQYVLFKHEVLERLHSGDIVLLLFCFNDFFNNTSPRRAHGVIEGDRVETRRPTMRFENHAHEWIKRHSYLANLSIFLFDFYRKRGRVQRQLEVAKAGPALPRDLPEVVITRHYLEQFRDRCRESGARFLIVRIPHPTEMDAERVHGEPTRMARTLEIHCRELDIPLLDLLGPLYAAAQTEAGPLYFPLDHHWTPAGHCHVAHILAAEFAGRGWVRTADHVGAGDRTE